MLVVLNPDGTWPSAGPICHNSLGGFPITTSGTHITLNAAWGIGAELRRRAEQLTKLCQKTSQTDLLYCEKRGGFQCRTCLQSTPTNATHGRCAIMNGTIHLDEGCCVLWEADPEQLHLYRDPVEAQHSLS